MKRFYEKVSVIQTGGDWQITLDGRGLRTQGGAEQLLPNRVLAEAMAAEWADQGEEIDPAAFILRDLADFALDTIAPDPVATAASLLAYAETDTLCYRADPDHALYAQQQHMWEPLVSGCEAALGVQFVRVSGIIHHAQPPATLARLGQELAKLDAFTLAGVKTMASLAASLITAMAALEDGAEAAALFAAAHLEEDWQAELWGQDTLAEADRALRLSAFAKALEFTRLARA